jgi:hypothetical protein
LSADPHAELFNIVNGEAMKKAIMENQHHLRRSHRAAAKLEPQSGK